ncbi:putative NAD dependent epimerase/dehydratase [Microthyrium microscopicum]|uniref:Putative NAD dependent epimerase/dehydratase n=1 Tax=Microthyrium microscopicum TaxID=703497 RepID=A0A6A6UBN6_9PEZI|nr:putative NAD dependent epimerase/dehydratase [Microthyrium microscopicum]
MASRKALVIRATGTQGTAVTRHLLQNNFIIHALVRDKTEDRALALQALGAILFEGTLNDSQSMMQTLSLEESTSQIAALQAEKSTIGNTGALEAAIEGCDSLYLNLMPSFSNDSETESAKFVLAAAKSTGVEHVIYSSAVSVGRSRDNPQWDEDNIAAGAHAGKEVVEELVRSAGIPYYTILKPGVFMTNFFLPGAPFMFAELGSTGEFVTSYNPETVLPLIDPNDIGAFAAAAFLDPVRFGGQEIPLAGDPLTVEELVQAIANASGKNIKGVYRSKEETEALAKVNPFVAGQILSLAINRLVNIEEVKTWGIPLGSFEAFMKREKNLVDKSFEALS